MFKLHVRNLLSTWKGESREDTHEEPATSHSGTISRENLEATSPSSDLEHGEGNSRASRKVSTAQTPAGRILLLPITLVVALAACISLAYQLSKINTFSAQWLNRVSSDCSWLQNSGNGDYWTSKILNKNITASHGSYSYWNVIFTLDIRTPPIFTFMQVKIIQALWDTFVGQGLRLLMAYTGYLVYSRLLLLFMKQSGVSHNFYVTVGFQGSTLWGILASIKELFFSPRLRMWSSWILMLYIILSMGYTLAFTSLISAAAGYIQPSQSRWQMENGVLLGINSDEIDACWVVVDGPRIGLKPNATISGPNYADFTTRSDICPPIGNFDSGSVTLFESFNRYFCEVRGYYARSPNQRNVQSSIMINTTRLGILPPLLNIEMGGGNVDELNTFGVERCYKGKMLGNENFPRLVCVSIIDSWSWGISSHITMWVLICQAIWCFGTWNAWFYAFHQSRSAGYQPVGPYKTAMILAYAMRKTLGKDMDNMTEDQLAKKLGKRKKGIRLTSGAKRKPSSSVDTNT